MAIPFQEHLMMMATKIDQQDFSGALDHAKKNQDSLQALFGYQILLGRIYYHLDQYDLATRHFLLGVSLAPQIKANYDLVGSYFAKMKLDIKMPESDVVFATGGYFIPTGFHGLSLDQKALGGSETSLVSLAKYWAKKGRRITVYCNCDAPGVYDGVCYRPNYEYFYATRSAVIPLLIALRYDEYLNTMATAQKKVLWFQDIPETRLYGHLRSMPDSTLIFLSQYHQEIWSQKFDLSEHQKLILPNGFDPFYFRSRENKSNQIIYASRPSRGLAVCLEVYSKLKNEYPHLKLKVCTYSQEKNISDDMEYAPFLQGGGIEGVDFLGQLKKNDFVRELAQSQFLLYPNITSLETSCVTAIEAMAAGCPVLASDRGALPETVLSGAGGLIIPYTDNLPLLVEKFANSASELLADPLKLSFLQDQCCVVAKSYSWQDLSDKWDHLYNNRG